MKWLNSAWIVATLLVLGGCQQERVQIGKTAPPLATFDSAQQQFDLPKNPTKPVILEFWTEDCGACIAMMKSLNKVAMSRSKQVDVIAVNMDKRAVDLTAVQNKWQLHFPLVRDQLGITQERYAVEVTPTTFWINRDGVVTRTEIGFSASRDLNRDVDRLLQNH
ncbi:TlpA family protein disulfide reductase [Celerinatantimonas sp. YJH-8]|uniref:TlpA family protein disulfide reductase n=1 Tax=Celerinatantimonas sp. YJH-8 TaxID=3228714 RepID=UPI0038BE458C